jgi:hypothetical protein
MRHNAASPVLSMETYSGLHAYDEQDAATPATDISFDAERLRDDLLDVGAWFENDGVRLAYPCKIDIIG